MKNVILNFPKQFAKGLEVSENTKIDGPFSNLIICGVGGSALPGSLLPDMGIKFDLPLFVHRDYGLPKITNQNSLIICISFSGNTEETLSAFEEATNKNYKVVAVCTGGKLEKLAKDNSKPVAVVPNDCGQPRFGTGYLVGAVLKVLSNCGLITDQSKRLLEMADNLKPENLEERGKGLANKLMNKIPIVYASNQYKSLARVWKIKFNENSKVMAFWNYFPELNHNEMVGLTNIKSQIANCKYYFIILKDEKDNPRVVKRMELTAELIKEAGAEVEMIEIQGATKTEKIFNTLLLGDWVSYYLSLAYDQDPTPVKIVEEFKKRLAQ